MKTKIPKTREEAFAILDSMLDDESKKTLIETDGFAGHFDIGMWIRNNWLYMLKDEKLHKFLKMFSDDEDKEDMMEKGDHYFFPCHPDNMSSEILEKYVEYLKNLKDIPQNETTS